MADTLFRNGRITTLDRTRPQATALAIKDGLFAAVGAEADIMTLQGDATKVIDLGGRRVVPGLNDSHTHVIRGGTVRALNSQPPALRWPSPRRRSNGLHWTSSGPSSARPSQA